MKHNHPTIEVLSAQPYCLGGAMRSLSGRTYVYQAARGITGAYLPIERPRRQLPQRNSYRTGTAIHIMQQSDRGLQDM